MKYLLALLIVFEIGDGVLTYFLVRHGLAREANPLLMPLVGDINFIWLKIIGVLVCALILWDVYRRYPRPALAVAAGFVVLYGALVIWNSSLFFRG